MIAHALSLSRLAMALPFAWCLTDPARAPLGALLVCAAIVTDLLDGVVARRMGTASDRGRLIDHSSDFAFVEAGLVVAAIRGDVPQALPILVAIAFAQYVIDSLVIQKRAALRPNPLGRWNGILYFVVLAVLVVSQLTRALEGLAPAIWLFGAALSLSTLASIASRLWQLRTKTT